jgi:hypothetical protein
MTHVRAEGRAQDIVRVVVIACLVVVTGAVGRVSAGTVSTTATEDLARAIHVCAAESDDARRIACYDKAANRVDRIQAPESRTGKVKVPQRPAVPVETPEQKFGLSSGEVLQREHVTQAPKVLTAQVVSVTQPPRGAMVLTLANGQVWMAQDADTHGVSVNVGDSVTITHEVLGGFLMTSSATGHRSISVRRVK